jgi:hypothetical protein
MDEVYMEKDRQKYEIKCQKKWNEIKTTWKKKFVM